jgi:hypothetical protein
MTTLLFASVRDTVLELLGNPEYLGATPGIIATLHPWSQTLILSAYPRSHDRWGPDEHWPMGGVAKRVFASVAGRHGALPRQVA